MVSIMLRRSCNPGSACDRVLSGFCFYCYAWLGEFAKNLFAYFYPIGYNSKAANKDIPYRV